MYLNLCVSTVLGTPPNSWNSHVWPPVHHLQKQEAVRLKQLPANSCGTIKISASSARLKDLCICSLRSTPSIKHSARLKPRIESITHNSFALVARTSISFHTLQIQLCQHEARHRLSPRRLRRILHPFLLHQWWSVSQRGLIHVISRHEVQGCRRWRWSLWSMRC